MLKRGDHLSGNFSLFRVSHEKADMKEIIHMSARNKHAEIFSGFSVGDSTYCFQKRAQQCPSRQIDVLKEFHFRRARAHV